MKLTKQKLKMMIIKEMKSMYEMDHMNEEGYMNEQGYMNEMDYEGEHEMKTQKGKYKPDFSKEEAAQRNLDDLNRKLRSGDPEALQFLLSYGE